MFEKVRHYCDLFSTKKYSEWEKDEKNEAPTALDICAHAFIAQAKAVFANPNHFWIESNPHVFWGYFQVSIYCYAWRSYPNRRFRTVSLTFDKHRNLHDRAEIPQIRENRARGHDESDDWHMWIRVGKQSFQYGGLNPVLAASRRRA